MDLTKSHSILATFCAARMQSKGVDDEREQVPSMVGPTGMGHRPCVNSMGNERLRHIPHLSQADAATRVGLLPSQKYLLQTECLLNQSDLPIPLTPAAKGVGFPRDRQMDKRLYCTPMVELASGSDYIRLFRYTS